MIIYLLTGSSKKVQNQVPVETLFLKINILQLLLNVIKLIFYFILYAGPTAGDRQ